MLGIENLWLFIGAGWLLNLMPGPDVLFIVTNAMRHGVRAGVVAAFGITAGCFVHIAAAAIGVSALISASTTAFTVLKLLGAAYLVYVGVNLLSKRKAPPDEPVTSDVLADDAASVRVQGHRHLRRIFVQGFWTNALNPKVALFFLAFIPQFIAPDAPYKTLSFVLLGLIFNVNAIPVNLAYALSTSWAASRLGVVQRLMTWLERGAGALFVYFGGRLAVAEMASN